MGSVCVTEIPGGPFMIIMMIIIMCPGGSQVFVAGLFRHWVSAAGLGNCFGRARSRQAPAQVQYLNPAQVALWETKRCGNSAFRPSRSV